MTKKNYQKLKTLKNKIMKELELKHLAGYLPYGLKIMVHDDFEMEMSHKRIHDNFEDDLKYISIDGVLEDFHCKPILRPLSDLTKEIEVNGKKFIPAEILFSVEENEMEDFKLYGILPDYWKDSLKMKPRYYNYFQVELMLEWHFDIYGLIENNLAIDKNTL